MNDILIITGLLLLVSPLIFILGSFFVYELWHGVLRYFKELIEDVKNKDWICVGISICEFLATIGFVLIIIGIII